MLMQLVPFTHTSPNSRMVLRNFVSFNNDCFSRTSGCYIAGKRIHQRRRQRTVYLWVAAGEEHDIKYIDHHSYWHYLWSGLGMHIIYVCLLSTQILCRRISCENPFEMLSVFDYDGKGSTFIHEITCMEQCHQFYFGDSIQHGDYVFGTGGRQ